MLIETACWTTAPWQIEQEKGNCARPCHSHCHGRHGRHGHSHANVFSSSQVWVFCNSLGFGLRQVGLLHARQAHGWSWTLQLQHELWLQLFDVLCVIRLHHIQPMLTSFCTHGLLISWISVFRKSHELPSLATIRLISHRNYWKNLFGCRPRQVQKNGQWYAKNPGHLSCAELRFVRKHCLKYRPFSNLLNQV